MVKVEISKSSAKNKKLTAVFYDNEGKKIKTVNFGDSRYSDYLQHKDKERRERYRKRHSVYLKGRGYDTAAHLSYWILWGDSSSLQTNINAYKKKYNLR